MSIINMQTTEITKGKLALAFLAGQTACRNGISTEFTEFLDDVGSSVRSECWLSGWSKTRVHILRARNPGMSEEELEELAQLDVFSGKAD